MTADVVLILLHLKGLRLNRALLYLSLANNQIRDSGAAHFSKVSIYIKVFNLYKCFCICRLSCFKSHQSYCIIQCHPFIFQVLSEFPLTHEEVVERRKLLASKMIMVTVS